MKNRILSILLALCLALTLLPTAALAGGTGKNWDAFKADAANPPSNHLSLSDYTLFQWPADAQTLTLAAQLSVRHNGTDNWSIPANITTHFAQGGAISLVSGATLTLSGPVTAAEDIIFRPMAVLSSGSATVELNNTCFVTRSDGNPGRTYITNNYTWNLNENGALGEVYLTGKLVGKGGTVNTVSVVADHGTSAGELGGTLKLTKLNVGLSDSANASLTIPTGAKITVTDSAANAHDGKFYLPAGSTLYLNGELTIETRSNRFNGTIVLGESGKLILKHQYPFTKSNGEEGKITGEGTLQYVHANTYLFENTTDSKLADINAARDDQSYDGKYDDLIASSVKIEKITESSGSGSSPAAPSVALPAPTDLAWGKYWYDEDGAQKYFESNGMISWKYPAGVSETDLALIRVYRVGTGENGGDELVWHSRWNAAAGKYWTDWDFSLDGIYGETEELGAFTAADYYFTVQMVDQAKNPTKVSTEVKSENWHYNMPAECLGTPTASVSERYVVSHTPADADNECNGGFNVVVYHSAERIANPTVFNLFSSFMKGEVDRLFAWVRYRGEPSYSDTLDISELLDGEDPGWCYAVVYTVSSDINTVGHTADGRVVEFQYKGSSSGDVCKHENTERKNYKAATCGETGYSGDIWCNDCETTVTAGQTLPATGKHISNGETDCTKEEVCTECSNVLRAAGSHTFGAWSKQDNTDHVRTCVNCHKPETAPHRWDQWTVTTPPTLENEGVKTFTCAQCHGTKTEGVSRLQTQEVGWTVNAVTWIYGQVGQVNNDAYNDSVGGGALSYSSSNTNVATVNADGRVTIVGAGTATITATAAAVANKYVATSAQYTLTVNKAVLTITAKNKTICYGERFTSNGYTVSGLVNGDSERVLTGTPTYTCAYEQFGKVSTYPISLTGLDAKNYVINFKPGVLTVEKATVYTITPGKLEQVAGHTSAVTTSITPYDTTATFKVEYQVGGNWTQTVPTETGSYAVRISLRASDNIAFTAGDYTNATLVVKGGVTVDNGSQSSATIGVQVEGEKATLTIDDPGQITDAANGDVTIDIGRVSGARELGLPAGLLTGLSGNAEAESLTVTTEDASVKFSGAVLDTVAEAVKGDDDAVTVRLTAVEKETLNDKQQAALESVGTNAVIVEVKLVVAHADGGETELHELGGEAEITVPYDAPVPAGKYIVVSYVSSDGSVSYIRATYNPETRQVSFKTNHFSHYVLSLSAKNTFSVTIAGGEGSGTYRAGDTVTIRAESRSGTCFTGWTVISGDAVLADSTAPQTTFTMPEGDVALRANYTTSSVAPATPTARPSRPAHPAAPFSDVAANSYYAAAVRWAVEKKITAGITRTLFAPEAFCTRAQIVTFLWRVAGCPEAKRTADFVDVSPDAYCAEAVAWAPQTAFTMPEGDVALRTNYTAGSVVPATPTVRPIRPARPAASFSDVAATSYYAVAVRWAVEEKITTGITRTLFAPEAFYTRAQIVTMLYRLHG